MTKPAGLTMPAEVTMPVKPVLPARAPRVRADAGAASPQPAQGRSSQSQAHSPAAQPPRPRSIGRAAQNRPAELAAELRVSLMRCVRRLRAEKSDRDVSAGQYSVLAVLDRHGPMSPHQLAEHEGVQPPSMTRTIAALTELGLVTRSDHPRDRRQVLVHLTEPGAATVRETRRRRDAWLARRLAELTPDERKVLAAASDILRRIAES